MLRNHDGLIILLAPDGYSNSKRAAATLKKEKEEPTGS
jgi:hypothetical protein